MPFEKGKLLTLRFSILTIFITFFILSISLILIISYTRAASNLSVLASNILQQKADDIFSEIVDTGILPAELEVELTADLIESGIINIKSNEELVPYMLNVIKILPLVQSAAWATENGTYLECLEEPNPYHTMVRVIDRSNKPFSHTLTYYDRLNNILSIKQIPDLRFEPTKRNWYEGAKKNLSVYWSGLFEYYFDKSHGVAVSKSILDKSGALLGVFSIKLRMDYIARFVNKQNVSPNGLAFIVSRSGKILSISNKEVSRYIELIDIHDYPVAWLGKSFDTFIETGKQEFTFKYQGEAYIAVYQAIPKIAGGGWYIGIIAPEDDFTGPLRKTNQITIGIGLIILMIGLFFVSQFVTRIVKPLNYLVRETEHIKHFNLEGDTVVKSRIKEIYLIANSIGAMKQGLRSFKKYVPSTLVRQLIETGKDAVIGGEKKQLAVFFTDIKDFTTISEHQDANQLVSHICEYLDALSGIIVKAHGTIDKYIGDAIMAFWGAPSDEPKAAFLAASAALQCQEALRELNQDWANQNKPIFITRFGLHLGTAVVGNIGSQERLNYTAIGDTINMASRLEALNKIYGTQIIASSEIYDAVGDKFIMRMIDNVAVKGKEESELIYELLGYKGQKMGFDIALYVQEFEKAFAAYSKKDWGVALRYFKASCLVHPHDTIAPIFIERCLILKKQPPPDDWDGVWHYSMKY